MQQSRRAERGLGLVVRAEAQGEAWGPLIQAKSRAPRMCGIRIEGRDGIPDGDSNRRERCGEK